jgi:hypothetical protein
MHVGGTVWSVVPVVGGDYYSKTNLPPYLHPQLQKEKRESDGTTNGATSATTATATTRVNTNTGIPRICHEVDRLTTITRRCYNINTIVRHSCSSHHPRDSCSHNNNTCTDSRVLPQIKILITFPISAWITATFSRLLTESGSEWTHHYTLQWTWCLQAE